MIVSCCISRTYSVSPEQVLKTKFGSGKMTLFSGFGGPRMRQAGCQLDHELTNLAVMGFSRVLPHLGQFYRLIQDAADTFRRSPPDAVVLVDYPGFNWWIARKARQAGIPVFYYLPPQLWAWASWRIARIRKKCRSRVVCFAIRKAMVRPTGCSCRVCRASVF